MIKYGDCMKQTMLIMLLSLLSPLAEAWTIKVKNDTNFDIAVVMYNADAAAQFISTGGIALAPLIGPMEGAEIENRIKKLKKQKLYAFNKLTSLPEDHSSGGGGGAIKRTVLDSKKNIEWKIGSGCVRALKAWIVEKKSINARDTLDIEKFEANSTLKNEIDNLKENKKWDRALKTNKPIDYIEYNPILSDKSSWTTKVVHANENQCKSHDFTVRVKKYDDGTKRLKIYIK
jgi:hypothetical protein